MKTLAEFHEEMHDEAEKEIQIKRKKRLIFRIVLVAGAIMGATRLLQQAGETSDTIAQTLYIVLAMIIIISFLLPRNIFKATGVEIQAVFRKNLKEIATFRPQSVDETNADVVELKAEAEYAAEILNDLKESDLETKKEEKK